MIDFQFINDGSTLNINTAYQISSNILNSRILIIISSRSDVFDSLTVYKNQFTKTVHFTLLGDADKKYKYTMSIINGTITCTSKESGLYDPYVTVVGIK